MRGLIAILYLGAVCAAGADSPPDDDPQKTVRDNKLEDSAKSAVVTTGQTPEITPPLDATAPQGLSQIMLTGPAQRSVQVSACGVSPRSIREGFTYRDAAKTQITLTQPARHQLVYQVVSASPDQVECGRIVFEKGDIKRTGTVRVNWQNVKSDCSIPLKIYCPLDSNTVLYVRLYLYPHDAVGE